MNKKTIIASLLICLFAIVLVGCNMAPTTDDVNAPKFKDLVDGKLPDLVINLGETPNFLEGVVAEDIRDGIVTVIVNQNEFDNKVIGEYEIKYSAVDKAGNLAEVTRKVIVKDTIAPYFNYDRNGLPAFEHLQYDESFDLLDSEYLAVTDNYDKAPVVTVKNDGGYKFDVAGKYTVIFEVTDASGNSSTASAVVTVKPALKFVVDTLNINNVAHPVQYNDETAMALDGNSGLKLRTRDEIQLMTKEFYLAQVEANKTAYATNGGCPFLPWGVAVILDADFKPVLVRNASYAMEAIKVEGVWELHKNGVIVYADGTSVDSKTTFVDTTAVNATTPSGILGGDFASYIPEGGYVILAGSPKGGKDDTGKVFLISNLMDPNFTGGALTWDGFFANGLTLLADAAFTYIKDDVTLYPEPDKLPSPVISITNHIMTWDSITNAKGYEIYVDGQLKTTVTTTVYLMKNLQLAPSAVNESYKITVVAVSKDIRYYGTSNQSAEVAYVMPDATTLATPVVVLEGRIIKWDAIDGAEKYKVFAKQLSDEIELAEVSGTSYNLFTDETLKGLTFNAFIYVRAIGDGNLYLDSEQSGNVVYMCGVEKTINFGDDNEIPVVVTTTSDYFAKRNNSTDVGYSSKSTLFLISDAVNIPTGAVEAYGFLVLFDKDGVVKAMINIVTTTKQYYNYDWVEASTISYTKNGDQITPLLPIIADGDQLLIGRSGGSVKVGELTLGGRDVLVNYYWGAYTAATVSANQPWRSAPTAENLPAFTITEIVPAKIAAPVLTLDGRTVKWEAVKGATKYEVFGKQLGSTFSLGEVSTNEFDLDAAPELAELFYKANISVKAIGDGMMNMDSDVSETLLVSVTPDKVINFGDDNDIPVVLTTASDYLAKRNDSSNVGYSGKSTLFLISDAINLPSTAVEAFSFLVLFDKDGAVKAIINILVTTKQYYNYQWVDASTISYANNNSQIKPILPIIAEGDQLLIGRNGGTIKVGELTLGGRDTLANYYWGAYTAATVSANQPWRSASALTTYPTFVVTTKK